MKTYAYILINKGNMKAPVEHFSTVTALMNKLFHRTIDKIKENCIVIKDEKSVIPLNDFNHGGDYMSQFHALESFIATY